MAKMTTVNSVLLVLLSLVCASMSQHLWVTYLDQNFGDVRRITANSSLTWDKNGYADQFSNQYLESTWGPTSIEYGSKLWVFYGVPYTIYYTTFDGTSYSADTELYGVGSTNRAFPVIFNSKLYLFHQGFGIDGQLWYNVFDSTTNTWAVDTQVTGVSLINSPGAVVFGSYLYVFFTTSSNEIHFRIFDGSAWTLVDEVIPSATTPDSPAPIVFQDSLYVFYTSTSSIVYQNTISGSWTSPTEIPTTSTGPSTPSPVVVNGLLYVFHQGWADGGLWYNTLNPSSSWLGDTHIPFIAITDSVGVALVDF